MLNTPHSVYSDQLRSGLTQAREKLIAAMETATGAMNAAQAKLAQQMADSSDRAEARQKAELTEQVLRVTQDVALRVQNLAGNAASAAATADDEATKLMAALEASGRVVRSCVEAKDSLLRDVDGVAGVARNHLRSQGTAGSGQDPLTTLAKEVAEALEKAGSMVEGLQQSSVKASIHAAQSLSAVAHEQWQGAAAELAAVGKEASAALRDAITVTSVTRTSGTEAQSARHATWEQLRAADSAVLAYRRGLSEVDAVVNGQLQGKRQNDRAPGLPGLAATYRIKPAPQPPGWGDEKGAPADVVEPPTVVFLAVPAEDAIGFSRSAAESAIDQKLSVSATRLPGVDGEIRYKTEKPLHKDTSGNPLSYGQDYRLFAVELAAAAGSRRGSRSAIARISLASLPVKPARTLSKVGRPRLHRLSKGQNAYVVRFDQVVIEGESKSSRSTVESLVEYRLLILRRSVWEAWDGLHGPDGPGDEKGAGLMPLPRSAAEDKAASTAQETKSTKPGRAGQVEAVESAAADEHQLARQREILLSSMLNEADWTVLKPVTGALEDWVEAIADLYQDDLKYGQSAGAQALSKEELSGLKQALKPSGAEDAQNVMFCYLHPCHLMPASHDPSEAGGRRGRPAKPTKNSVPVGRYSDVRGELLDPDMTQYVAVVYIAGVPDQSNVQSVEDSISEPSEPFGSLTTI